MVGVNQSPSAEVSSADLERIRRRYPRSRAPRPLILGVLTALALVLALWLVWTVSVRSQPPVTATVPTFSVVSARQVEATVSVNRRDPSQTLVCRVLAQDVNFQPVGERLVEIPPASERLVIVEVDLTTLRRAVSVTVKECTPT